MDVDSESEDMMFPEVKFGISVMAPHGKDLYRNFKQAVDPHPEIGIDTVALRNKFHNILKCIITIGLRHLTTTIGSTNIDMVKEFYANWEPGFDIEKEYVVEIQYGVMTVTALKGEKSAALTTEQRNTRMEQSIRILFKDLKMRAERGESSLEELQHRVPLGQVTKKFLGLEEETGLSSDEDTNSLDENEQYYTTFGGTSQVA
ncbi:hypothetical protein K7X08_021457 [Anisodus acutangulus]|uniref:Uncharacterized protein n=1 Tax=Anisodus acutangulus TaxID=402998 RepID=A0A9Q1M951_9SOLA|nr:hypothetical protein K7X08_021457 [Anisodus acutangulus]